MTHNLRRDVIKAAMTYLILISITYSPFVFYNRTLSMAARYPWFEDSPPERMSVFPEKYPYTLNVDIASPAALEEPIDVFVGNQLRRGIFPMWNPYIACGNVVQEEFATRTLFPYQLLQFVCPWSWRDFFLLGRILIAAMGVFIFLRLRGVSFYPSLCGGVMYGFSGAMTVFLNFTEISNVGMILPYTLLGVELLYRNSNIFSFSFCSLAVSLSILAGQPEAVLYGLLLICLYFIFRMMVIKEKNKDRKTKLIFFFLSMILALIISSPFFVPFLMNRSHLHTLHVPGGTMGVEGPTPPVNFMAIIFPELLRWQKWVPSFTQNFGWDSIGGYVGIGCIIFIIASFKIKWWGRKEFLFFLSFAVFILLKDMGVPIISWIGRLPIFDQVWTPRWTGPVWCLSLVLSSAMGFEALIGSRDNNFSKRYDPNPSQGMKHTQQCVLLGMALLILSFGALVNPESVMLLRRSLGILKQISFNGLSAIRIFLISIGSILLWKARRYFKLPIWFFILSLGVIVCIYNFNYQLPHIEGRFFEFLVNKESFVDLSKWETIGDNALAVLVSMWQGMAESTIFSLTLLLGLALVMRKTSLDKIKFTYCVFGVIVIEMTFHVTVGYIAIGRLLYFIWHIVALVCWLFFCLLPRKDTGRRKLIFLISLFCVGMILLGAAGLRSIPKRGEVFKQAFDDSEYDGYSRIMGIKGIMFPNSSAVFGLQDVKSIVSIGIKRHQLFKDHCLSAIPQEKYKSLWFTGIMDPGTEKNIAEHIEERYQFYALAGVTNYLSPHYENIPYTQLIEDGPIKNYKNLAAMPRAFIVYKWSLASTPEESLQWLLSHRFTLDSEAVVEGVDIPSIANPRDELSTRVEIKSYTIHSVVIEAETNVPGLLVLTDTYYPDWMVKVNGKNKEIYPVDLCFRGVFLEPGKHELRFVYFPKVFYICCVLALLTLLGLSLLCIKSLLCRKYYSSKN